MGYFYNPLWLLYHNILELISNDVTTKNEQNLQSAYNELKSMTGLLVQKYNLDENQFVKSLEVSYQAILGSLPDTLCDTEDLAMNGLMNTFKELMPENERKAVKNAVIEVAQRYKDVEGANITGFECRDIIGSGKTFEEVTNLYTAPANAEQYVQVAQEAINDLINNFDNMTFPKEVNKQEFLDKLKNYNPENITNLGQNNHRRFGLIFSEQPSKADIAVAIMSDLFGIYKICVQELTRFNIEIYKIPKVDSARKTKLSVQSPKIAETQL